MEPFLLNHQYNRIAQQAKVLLSALQTSSDRKVVDAARYSALTTAAEACPGLSGDRLQLVERLGELRSSEELQVYLSELHSFTYPFPGITEKQVKGLFPKIKKLKLPDFTRIEGRPLTYVGWTDPASNRLFLVYPRGGSGMAGVEGRMVPTNKKGVCAFCNRTGETALFTVESKARMSHLPDYYKAVGQYICVDSEACNSRITDLEALERFFEAVSK